LLRYVATHHDTTNTTFRASRDVTWRECCAVPCLFQHGKRRRSSARVFTKR